MAFHIVHVHHERIKTHSHAGRPELQLVVEQKLSPHSGSWPRPLERGPHWAWQGDGALAQICGWFPWRNQTKLLSVSHGGQVVLRSASDSGMALSFLLGTVGKCVFFYSQRGQGWPEFLETPTCSSLNYLACLFCSRSGLGWFYLGDYHVFQPWQEALYPERIHISNDRWIFSPIIYNHRWGSDLTGK